MRHATVTRMAAESISLLALHLQPCLGGVDGECAWKREGRDVRRADMHIVIIICCCCHNQGCGSNAALAVYYHSSRLQTQGSWIDMDTYQLLLLETLFLRIRNASNSCWKQVFKVRNKLLFVDSIPSKTYVAIP